jgi:quercetin dioxygenase-like cupin family protein
MKQFNLAAAVLTMVALCLGAFPALAQDAVKVDPKHHKVEFENEKARVLRVTLPPHEKTAEHEHPGSVVVFLTDSNNQVSVAGKTRNAKQKRGDVIWLAGEKHVVENATDQPFEAIVIELKTSQ